MNVIDIYIFVLVFCICCFIYFYFKENENKKDYYIKDGIKIPKNIKYFNISTNNEYTKKLLDNLNIKEQNDFVLNILKRFSGYHQYDYYEYNELKEIENNSNLKFTKKMIEIYGLKKVKEIKKENSYFKFEWYEIVNDYRESSKGYKKDWSSLNLIFEEDIIKNNIYIDNLKKTNPELFIKEIK